jgi:predicted PurR-regulated permease PerM
MTTLPDSPASAGKRRTRPAEAAAEVGLPSEAGPRRRWRLLFLGLAILGVLWLASGIIGPFVVAGVIAYAFSPIVSAVENRTRLPRALIIGIGYLIFIGLVAGVAVLAAERVGVELRELTSGGQDPIAAALHKLFGNTLTIAGQQLVVADLARQIRDTLLGAVRTPTNAVQMATQAVDLGLQVILTLIITFYLLLDGHRFGQFALRFLDRSQRAEALRIAQRIHVVLGRWLRGQLLLIALVSAVIYVILGPILHVPYALAIAALSGVLEIIPLVGPLVAAALAATVAYAAHGTDTTIVVIVVYFVIRQVEDQVVMPLVIGRAVHLHPVVTIFAVLVGLSTWGVFGGLMGVPVAAALNVTLHELYREETGGESDVAWTPESPEDRPRRRRLVPRRWSGARDGARPVGSATGASPTTPPEAPPDAAPQA